MKAKRCFAMPLLLIMLSILIGCSSKLDNVSDEHYQYGMKAIEIVDSYLDYDIDAEEAYNKVDELMGRADTLPNENISSATCVMDTCIECDVSLIKYKFSDLHWHPSNENLEKLKEYRNSLAEYLNLNKR